VEAAQVIRPRDNGWRSSSGREIGEGMAPPACAVTGRRSRTRATGGVSRDSKRLSTKWFCSHAADSARPRGKYLGSKGFQACIEHCRRRQIELSKTAV